MLTAASFALLVNHDDGDREYAYSQAAENAAAKAEQLGWTVVSMKNDWAAISEAYPTWAAPRSSREKEYKGAGPAKGRPCPMTDIDPQADIELHAFPAQFNQGVAPRAGTPISSTTFTSASPTPPRSARPM